MGETLKSKLQAAREAFRSGVSFSAAESSTFPSPTDITTLDTPATIRPATSTLPPPSSSPRPTSQLARVRSSAPSLRRAFSITRTSDQGNAQSSSTPATDKGVDQPSISGMTDSTPSPLTLPKPLPALTVEEPTPPTKPVDAPTYTSTQAPPAFIRPAIRPQPPPTPLSRTVSFRPVLSRASTTDSTNFSQLRQVLDFRTSQYEPALSPTKPVEASRPEVRRPMSRRKIWVRRPGASATLVQIAEDDLVDDVRDMILRKYANSLGRSFDSPDVTLRVVPRPRSQHAGHERVLGPEEPMCTTLDSYFPGGQTVNEALLIDVPQKRTPRPSPRLPGHHHTAHFHEDTRPAENDTGYFPPMSPGQLTPRESRAAHHPHSISILETGQAPALPSPRERKMQHRPRVHRQQTGSPSGHPGAPSSSSYAGARGARTRRDSNDFLKNANHAPIPPPLPSPPASDLNPSILTGQKVATPPIASPRVASGSSGKARKNRNKMNGAIPQQQPRNAPPLSLGAEALLNGGAVPPINVLLVEDNIINLKLLEMFVKRLKVRWSSVMNGRDAVTKWREGGFHLVLMDIQLPIMNGLEATKAIRRLERVNGIGVFARSQGEAQAPNAHYEGSGTLEGEDAEDEAGRKSLTSDDELPTGGSFKSPVIIVALTASSLQSDRHEALAAGCNDFLTKPVNFPWFERKVMEWGCMQALIDFDGWRQWKALSQSQEAAKLGANGGKAGEKKPETEEERVKREKKEARKAAILAKMGQA